MGYIEELHKKHGASDDIQDVTGWLDSGLLALNKVISGRHDRGFPIGRVTEIFGGESSGKTALATMAMVRTQQLGGFAVFLDHERSFSLSRAQQFGLITDPKHWYYKQPAYAEQSFGLIDYIAHAINSEDPTKHVTIVVDSIAAMVTKQQQETAFGEENMNTHSSMSRVLSAALPKIVCDINKTNTTLILLNQIRDNVGQMMGPKTKTTGGRSLPFYASVRIELTKPGKLKDGDEIYGERIKAVAKKNKVSIPFRECIYNSDFETGIDFVQSHIDYANDLGLLGSTKGWIEYGGSKMRAKDLAEKLRSDPSAYQEFLKIIYQLDEE